MISNLKYNSFFYRALGKAYYGCLLAIVSLGYGAKAMAQDSTANATDTTRVSTTTVTSAVVPVSAAKGTSGPVYKMNYWITGGFCVLATAGNLYAIPNILHGKKDITHEQLQAAANLRNNNRNDMNFLDRWVLDQDPTKRDKYKQASDYILPAVILSGGILAFDKGVRQDWFKILLMYYETQAATFTLYNFSPIGPGVINRYRPYIYYNENINNQAYFSEDYRKEGNGKNSFFSGHTANVAASTFFMVKVYSDYHPELGGKKYLLYTLAAIPPLVEGYIRIKALEHFTTDVLSGFAVGAITGIVIPALHKIKNPNLQVSMSYSGMGAGLGMKWRIHNEEKKLLTTYPTASVNTQP